MEVDNKPLCEIRNEIMILSIYILKFCAGCDYFHHIPR